MRTAVVGAGGARIGVRVEGTETGPPIVFVHGWAQSARAWDFQFAEPRLRERFRLIAQDLRGHGTSDVPSGGYDDPVVWADDLAAVLGLAGEPAVVVGWSYGALVLTDYVRVHGTKGLAGLVLVGGITEIGRGHPGGRVGPVMSSALPDVLSEDLDVALPALTRFVADMSVSPVPGAFAQSLLGASLSVPPSVRAALFRRDVDSADVLASIDVPTLVLHGSEDTTVDPSAGEYAAGKIPGARTRWWVGVGHIPFVEAAKEFNETLARFVEERAQGARAER